MLKGAKLERHLDDLAQRIDRIIGKEPSVCIFGTKLAVEALRLDGISARPIPVEVIAASWEHNLRTAVGRRSDGPGEDPQEWTAAGAWSLGVSKDVVAGSGWSGHLVALVENRYILDTTARQFSRPQHNMHFPAFWQRIDRDFLKGDWHTLVVGECGETLMARHTPENKSFAQAPAWCNYRVDRRGSGFIAVRTARFRPDVISRVEY